MIVMHVAFDALDGQADAFAELLRRTAAGSRAEDGCVVYQASRDLDVAGRFHLFELWRDEDSFRAHSAGPVLKAFIQAMGPLARVGGAGSFSGPLEPYQPPRRS